MTIDEAMSNYSKAISTLPDRKTALDALAELFIGIRAHEDHQTIYGAFATAIPAPSRVQHVAAMKALVLDLAECK